MGFSGPNKKQECIDFASAHWENLLPKDVWTPAGYIEVGGTVLYDPSGTEGNQNSSETKKINYTQSEIAEACTSCANGSNACKVMITFYGFY